MELTTNFLKHKHSEYNKEYFGGCLPNVIFIIKKNKRTLGHYLHKHFGLSEIMISTYYDRSERDFCRTLLHEMIHQYIDFKGLKDTSMHGRYFKEYSKMLNAHGWNITAREKLPSNISTTEKHEYHVIKFREKSGSYFIFVSCSSHYNDFFQKLNQLSFSNGVYSEIEKYKTTNPIFSTFPQCRSNIRGRRITKDELPAYR